MTLSKIRDLEQIIEMVDLLIKQEKRGSEEYNCYLDDFVELQLEYKRLTGDFYGRQSLNKNKSLKN